MDTVFISYSHQDEDWKDRVQSHLSVLEKHGKLSIWDDRQIPLGGDWLGDIEQSLEQANIALLLVSRHFLNSDFIRNKEIPKLLRRREQNGLKVIPIMLTPCSWDHVDWLSAIQGYPKDNKPLSGLTEHQIDEALAKLASGLVKADQPHSDTTTQNTPKTGQQPKAINWPLIAVAVFVCIAAIALIANWPEPTKPDSTDTNRTQPTTTNITINSEGSSKPTVATGNASVTINHTINTTAAPSEDTQK